MPKVCPTCGHENADDADFCASCSTYLRWDLTVEHGVVTPPQEPSPGEESEDASAGLARPPDPPPPREERGPSGTRIYPQARPGEPAPKAANVPDAVVLSLHLPGEEGAGAGAPSVEVAPGAEAVIVALVRNSSGIVDNYDIAVTGLPAAWWTATPATVYLVPYGSPAGDYEQEIEIRLHPPVGPEAEARPWRLKVSVSSRAHEVEVASAPATLVVGAFQALEAEIRPERAGGRRKADFAVAVRNRANAPAEVQFSGSDPEGTLRFDFQQPRVVAQPGHRAGTAFSVRPPKQIIIGKPVERRFELLAQGVGGEELMLKQAGAFRQKAWLPRWLLVAVPLLIAGAIALWLLLFAGRVEVPKVVGLPKDEAQKRILEAGFEYQVLPDKVTDDPDKINRIESQLPNPGSKEKKGTTVYVVVWQESGKATVPNFVGRTLADADDLARKAGLDLEYPETDDPSAVTIASQLPKPNRVVDKGDAVTLSFEKADGEENGNGAVVPIDTGAEDTEPEVDYPDFIYESGGDFFVASGNDPEDRKPLTQTPEVEKQPVWNPAGTRIAYSRGPGDDAQIWLMNPSTARARPVTDGGHFDNRPAFSPNGKVIAFTRGADNGEDTDSNLCFVRADARNAVPSCKDEPEQNVRRPVWSPNGRSILVIAEEDNGQTELLLYSTDSPESPSQEDWFNQGFVTQDKHSEDRREGVGAPAWSSDGSRVAFAASWDRENYYLVLASPKVEGAKVDLGEVDRKTQIGACEVAWVPGREELAITRRGADCGGSVGEIVRLDLTAPEHVTPLAFGNDPSWQP